MYPIWPVQLYPGPLLRLVGAFASAFPEVDSGLLRMAVDGAELRIRELEVLDRIERVVRKCVIFGRRHCLLPGLQPVSQLFQASPQQ